jgi:hypothetical protein
MHVVARYEQCAGHTMGNPTELEEEAAARVAACPERALWLAEDGS